MIMSKEELIKRLEDEDFFGEGLFEKPIDLEDFRIVQSKDYEYEDGSFYREELASMSLVDFILETKNNEGRESDESLWNPNGEDMDEFLNDQLWD